MAIGSSATGRISVIAPIKPAIGNRAIDPQLAGDTAYREQMNEAHRALADYQTRMVGSQNSYNTNYRRNLNTQNDREKLDQVDQADDYASRGMSNSGLRVRAASELHTNYDKQQGTLDEGKADFMGNLKSGFQDFQSQQRLNDTRYRNDAINRRASYLSAGLT